MFKQLASPRLLHSRAWLLCILLLPARVQAQTGAEIMASADRMNRPRFEMSTMQMELLDPAGGVLKRELTWHFRNEQGKRTSLMKFTAPANMQGVGILVIEEKGAPNAIWHYLPASRNVRRIAAAHRQNRFMGTEFVFEDFEGLKLDKYAFTLAGSKKCAEGSQCHMIEARASDKEEMASSSYGKKVFYVDRQSLAIVKTELYDKNEKLVKVFEASGWGRLDGYWRPQLQTMRNVTEQRVTRLRVIERKLDPPFEPYYTSQQYLRSE